MARGNERRILDSLCHTCEWWKRSSVILSEIYAEGERRRERNVETWDAPSLVNIQRLAGRAKDAAVQCRVLASCNVDTRRSAPGFGGGMARAGEERHASSEEGSNEASNPEVSERSKGSDA